MEELWVCPHCGMELTNLTSSGKPRMLCNDPKCQGRAWGKHSAAMYLVKAASLPEDTPPMFGRLCAAKVREIREQLGKTPRPSYSEISKLCNVTRRQVQTVSQGGYKWVS